MLISQRPAKLHKDSLTQVETLVAMRLIAPQDRDAVSDWIADQADKDQGKEIVACPDLSRASGSITTFIGAVCRNASARWSSM